MRRVFVSLPDEVFARLSRQAELSGLSRSELLTRAATAYVDGLDTGSLTTRTDAALRSVDADRESREIVEAGKRHLLTLGDDW